MEKTRFYLLTLVDRRWASALASIEKTFKVLQFNIWQDGAVVKGGFDAIAARS